MRKLAYHVNRHFCIIIGLISAFVVMPDQKMEGTQVIQTLPFYDSFDYNPSTPSTGLAAASSTVWETCYPTSNIQVTTNGLTLAGFVPSAGNSVLGVTHGSRFAGTQFTAQTNIDGFTVYVSFLYQVTAYPTTTPGVIAFLDSTNIGSAQSGVMPGYTGLALLMDHTGHIGINAGSTNATTAHFESSPTALNTTVLIVGRYTFHPAASDTVDLWVDPNSSSYGAASAPASDESVTNTLFHEAYLANFTISYNDSDSTFGERWDEVRIGTNWAQVVPSSNIPGPANAAHSLMLSATPASIVASGATTSVVMMQARDINGLNLTTGGSTVTFATTLGAVSSATDNGNGTYQATLTSSTSLGSAKVTAKLGQTAIATIGTATNSPSLTVNFVPGPVSATASTATANPTTVAADGSSASTITVTAMDNYGHPLTNQTVLLNVSGSGNTVSTPAPTGANGLTTATLTSTVAETKTITVTIAGTQINEQPTVTFTSLGVSAANSTVVASPNLGVVADGVSTSTITVTAIDGDGNPLSGKTVTLSVSGSGNILTQPAPTGANGQTTATLQSTVAETKTIMVTVDGTVINAQPTVTFVAGPATQIAFTSEPVTTPAGLTMANVVVQIEDQYSNAVPESGAAVTLALSSGTLSGTNPQITDAGGKATFNDLSIQPISYSLYLTASVAGFSPVQSSLFNAPPQTFYKLNNATPLNSSNSWTAVEGSTNAAGPPAAEGIGEWATNSTGGTVDIGGSAAWYGLVMMAQNTVTITDTNGGHTLTLGAGSLDGSAAVHSFTMSNNVALAADQTWVWASHTLTLAGNLDTGGHLLTIDGQNSGVTEIFLGAITGAGGLILESNAAVTLSGTNTYSGDTAIDGGKLIINTNGSIANTPIITLVSNVTLDVSAASPFTIFNGQTLSGSPTGSKTATIVASTTNGPGTLTLAAGAQAGFTAAVNTSSNSVSVGVINVQGGVSLNNNLVSVNVTGAPLPPGTYTLMIATNGFTMNGSLPTPVITGQGLAGNSIPQIVVNGQDLQLVADLGVSTTGITNNCGDSATFTAAPAIGATGYQWYNPSQQPIPGATNLTLVLPDTHPSDSGTYLIVATSPDSSVTNSVFLLTTDSAPPVISLNGNNPMPLALGSPYSEPGATAYDACAGTSVSVSISGTVNTSVAGEYDITYSAVGENGVTGSVTRAVIVFDPTAIVPGITMDLDFGAATDVNPTNPITPPEGWSLLAFGDLYQDPEIWGSPSFPNPDGNNTGLILSFGNISGWSTVSTEAGADSGAVAGISANGFFNYGSKGSGLPATFTLTGIPTGECVSIYAVDGWNGAPNAPVIVYGGQTNTVTASSLDASPTIGDFQYVGTAIATNGTVTGSWTGTGGPTTEGQIGGMIIKVQSIPLNNLSVTPSSIAAQCGVNATFTASVYGLPPITYQWYDNNNNPIPGATNASYTLVDPTDGSVGNYTVIAQNAYNSLTNTATITTVLHSALPVMSLNGGSPVYVMLDAPYVEAGATAYDLCAQASLPVTSNSTVNTSAVGTYSVTYHATTADGTPGSITRTVIVSPTPYFGTNVLIFDSSMTNIQCQIDGVFAEQVTNQFGAQRNALLFKPGNYNNLDIPVGFYTQLLGLGLLPDDVTISGYIHSDGVLFDENATENFWRSAENFAVDPTNSPQYSMTWAVSQGTALRRMHIEGSLVLADSTSLNYSSGGFMSDSAVDGTMSSVSQQQWLDRNDVLGNWVGGVWNMVFVGVSNPPAGVWPAEHYTEITNTPIVAEKPFLYLDTNGNYAVMVPALETNSFGITWSAGFTPGTSLSITNFYVAQPGIDDAASINAALNAGLNLLLTPGVYQLTNSVVVTRPDTIILGLGYPTLIPETGSPALEISDVNGVKVAGLLFDAGPIQTPTLMQVGNTNSSLNHSCDPIFLYDISMRVGGAAAGSTESCLQINANDVVGDNLWLWRADHGNAGAVGWTNNPCNNGLIVNGDRVTMYGLFVEHHEQFQTLWNGNWGRTYFYQSELPYDPPSQEAWSYDGEDGYASYKVADQVTSHQAYGLGVYAVFINCTNISCFNAIETPTNSQPVNMHDMITVYIAGNTTPGGTSALYHIINGAGASLYGPGFGGIATNTCLWLNPTFGASAALTGSGATITFPSESWHSYQLQYKNDLTDPAWSNIGAPVGGNDVLQAITDPTLTTNRFYQVSYPAAVAP